MSGDKDFRASILNQLKETLNHRRNLDDDGDKDDSESESEPSVKQLWALDPVKQRQHLDNKEFEAEIGLKKTYGVCFLVILAFQLLIMNGVFIAVGMEKLTFKDNLTLQLYMGGTMTEVFGLVLVVTKYLFKRR